MGSVESVVTVNKQFFSESVAIEDSRKLFEMYKCGLMCEHLDRPRAQGLV